MWGGPVGAENAGKKKNKYFFRLLINYFILGNILIKKLTKTVKINAKPKTKQDEGGTCI